MTAKLCNENPALAGGKMNVEDPSAFAYPDEFAKTNFTLSDVYIVIQDVCVNNDYFQTPAMENLKVAYTVSVADLRPLQTFMNHNTTSPLTNKNRGAYAEYLGDLNDDAVSHFRRISSKTVCIYLTTETRQDIDARLAGCRFTVMDEDELRTFCNKSDLLHAAHNTYINDHPITKSLPVTDLSDHTIMREYLKAHEGFTEVLNATFLDLKQSIGRIERNRLRSWINAIQPKLCREHLKRKATKNKSTADNSVPTVHQSEGPSITVDQAIAANNNVTSEVQDFNALDSMVDGPVEYSDLLEAIRRLPKQEVNPFWVESHGTTPPPAVGPSDYAKSWEWYYPEGEVDPGSPPRDRPAHAGIKGNKWMYDIYWNSNLFKGRLDMPESSNVTAERLRKVDTDLFEKWTDEKGLEKEAEKGLEKEAEKKHEKEYEKE